MADSGGSSFSELQMKAMIASQSTIQRSLKKEKRAFLFQLAFVLFTIAFICS